MQINASNNVKCNQQKIEGAGWDGRKIKIGKKLKREKQMLSLTDRVAHSLGIRSHEFVQSAAVFLLITLLCLDIASSVLCSSIYSILSRLANKCALLKLSFPFVCLPFASILFACS